MDKPGLKPVAMTVRLTAVIVFLISASIAGIVVWRLEQSRLQEERLRVAALAGDHTHAIQSTLERALSTTYALAAMIRQGQGNIPDFDGVATELIALTPGVASISLSPGGIIQRAIPVKGNEKSIGFNQLADPVQSKEAFIAKKTGKLTLAGPLNLVQGGLGVVGRLPVFLELSPGQPEFWGFVSVAIRFPQALEGARLNQLSQQGLNYELWRTHPETGQKQIIDTSDGAALIEPVIQGFELPNGRWMLSIAPQAGWDSPGRLAAHIAFGLAFSLLLAYAARLVAERRAHEKGLESLVSTRTTEIVNAQNKLQATLDSVPDLIAEVSLDGMCHDYHAPRWANVIPPPGLVVGQKLSTVLPESTVKRLMKAVDLAMVQGRSEGLEFVFQWLTGEFWIEVSVTRKPGSSLEEPRFIVLAKDITERKQSESDLRVAAAAFNSQQAMVITAPNQIVLQVNPAFTAVTGFSSAEAVGRKLDFLDSDRHPLSFYETMWETANAKGVWRGEIWNRRKNGELYPDLRSMTAVRDEDGIVTHYVNTFEDNTERKAAEEEINKLAFFDPLTQLPNRRLLLDRLHHALANATRSGSIGALNFIDLDNFKTLNDTLGHDKGDLLLQQVGQRLTECVRDGDTVARLGGDEFVVMLEDLSNIREVAAAGAKAVGEKILAAINLPYQLAGHEYNISPSVGVTLFTGYPQSTDELLKQADLAMYQAKSAGRNTVRFFDPTMQAVVSARVALETDIRQGILKGQFQLYFQPQIDRQGLTQGAEVLLRWPHPVRGMVPPVDFIGLAEETGQILMLGQWVLETACAQLVTWSRQPDTAHLTLAVNVSARQFRQQDFAEDVLGLIEYTGANPQRLKLELTESLLIKDVEGTIEKMNALQARGVGFSLDDFGTGYSSLSYLKRLPLDQLKIDQSFVRDLMTDPNDAAIARTVIALGHSLGLAVIAEGVETAAQRDFLAEQGCDGYQGYYFGRPMPIGDFEKSLRRGDTHPP